MWTTQRASGLGLEPTKDSPAVVAALQGGQDTAFALALAAAIARRSASDELGYSTVPIPEAAAAVNVLGAMDEAYPSYASSLSQSGSGGLGTLQSVLAAEEDKNLQNAKLRDTTVDERSRQAFLTWVPEKAVNGRHRSPQEIAQPAKPKAPSKPAQAAPDDDMYSESEDDDGEASLLKEQAEAKVAADAAAAAQAAAYQEAAEADLAAKAQAAAEARAREEARLQAEADAAVAAQAQADARARAEADARLKAAEAERLRAEAEAKVAEETAAREAAEAQAAARLKEEADARAAKEAAEAEAAKAAAEAAETKKAEEAAAAKAKKKEGKKAEDKPEAVSVSFGNKEVEVPFMDYPEETVQAFLALYEESKEAKAPPGFLARAKDVASRLGLLVVDKKSDAVGKPNAITKASYGSYKTAAGVLLHLVKGSNPESPLVKRAEEAGAEAISKASATIEGHFEGGALGGWWGQ